MAQLWGIEATSAPSTDALIGKCVLDCEGHCVVWDVPEWKGVKETTIALQDPESHGL